METKYCKECGGYKPINEFHKSQKSLLCKFHHNLLGRELKKKYRKDPNNKEKEKIKYEERKIRLWVNTLINNSKKRGYENTLTIEDVLEIYKNQNGMCFWFKIPMIPSLTKKHPQQPSLDRIDRFKGYTKDNVVLSCYSANIGRNETDVELWSNFIDVLLNKTNKTEEMIKSEILSLEKKLEDIDDRDEYIIYDENLNTTIVKNLNEYCRNNDISFNTLKSLRKKIKRTPQKGIIILNRTKGEEIEKRVYRLISPDGIEHIIPTLRNFCIENGLNDSALHRVGKGELKHYKGWECEYKTIILK
jgi:hypothetical protein